jgi:hypothetical protein
VLQADEPVRLPRVTIPEIDLTRLLTGDWLGAARVAVGAWVMAIVLSVGLLALMNADGITVKQFLIGVALVLSSAFGGDVIASSDLTDSDFSYAVSVGVYPLTVTLAALTFAVWLFWRQVRRYDAMSSAVFHALRTSVVFALLVVVPVVALRGSMEVPASEAAPELFGGLSGQLGGRALSAALLSFLYLALVLTTVVLARRMWLPARLARLHDLLAVPVTGLLAMVLVTPVLGFATAAALFALLEDSAQSTATAAAMLALLPNLGFAAAMVGGGVGMRMHYTDSTDSSMNSDDVQHLTGLADQVSNWVWLLPIATVLLFATGALVTVLRSGTRRAAARNLLTWLLVSMVASPVMGHFVGLHMNYEGSGFSDEGTESGTMFFGLVAWQVFLVAGLAAFVVAVAGSAAVRARTVGTASTAPGYTAPDASAPVA